MHKRSATSSDALVSLITPCHRVTGAGKNLTDYAGGLWCKTILSIPKGKNVSDCTRVASVLPTEENAQFVPLRIQEKILINFAKGLAIFAYLCYNSQALVIGCTTECETERYRSGYNGPDSKSGVQSNAPRVRIPLSPPFVYRQRAAPREPYGALAQLGARNTGSVEVRGSNPLCSTTWNRGRTRGSFLFA